MPSHAPKTPQRASCALGAALIALALAGCAQQRAPGYYNPEHDSTLSDAQQQAQGVGISRAPSQVQLGFGDTTQKPAKPAPAKAGEKAEAPAAAAPAATAIRPLMEARTFLGTVPCLGDTACSAARVTLTLAPSGEWRSRTQVLGQGDKAPILEQGCWVPVGSDPWRILLTTPGKQTTSNLTFITDNTLRITSVNGVPPTLNYHLTRQADVDGIDEMSKRPALKCNPS